MSDEKEQTMPEIKVITDPVETLKAQNAQMYDLLCGLRGKEHALDPLEPVEPAMVSGYDPWTESP